MNPNKERPQGKGGVTARLPAYIALFKKVSDVLMSDVWRCHAAISNQNQLLSSGQPAERAELQFWARSMFRSFCALVEGNSAAMARILLLASALGEVELTFAEQAILRQEEYSYDGRAIRSRPRYTPAVHMTKLTLSLFPRLVGCKHEPATGDSGWESFRNALETRNSITHPKSFIEFELSSEAIGHLANALRWYTQEISRVFTYFADSIDERLERTEGDLI